MAAGWWKQHAGRVAASVVNVVAQLQPGPERALSPPEREVLRTVYADSVDLSRVRLRLGVGGALGISGRAFVIGDTVFLPTAFLPLAPEVLVHELCHVWQHQHGGYAYIADSLEAQWVGDGYQLEKGLREGRAWHQLNCEQQATLLEVGWEQGCFQGRPLILSGIDRTSSLRSALAEVHAGRGAAFAR
jgi:hypothetical protein